MTRYRPVVLALFLTGLLATPFAFADKNKGSSGDSGKSSPPQHSAPQHSSSTHDNSGGGQHGSGHGTDHGSGSGSSTHSSNDHSGNHHSGTSQSAASSQSHGNSQNGHGNNSGDVLHRGSSSSSTKTYGHDSSRSASSYHGTRDSHGHVNVDHARLNERLHAHSSAIDRQHAFEHSRFERTRFTRRVAPIRFVPAHRAVLMNIRIVPTTYHYRRTVFYDTYDWQPPAYVFGLYPRYGLWDATFLAFALDHVAEEQYALMFYNHRNEDEMQQWMDDTSRLAADNDDLREKLDTMKTRMASFDRTGVTTDPSYVPPDAQDVALSPEVITQLTASK